jgi:hypothetical protein
MRRIESNPGIPSLASPGGMAFKLSMSMIFYWHTLPGLLNQSILDSKLPLNMCGRTHALIAWACNPLGTPNAASTSFSATPAHESIFVRTALAAVLLA